MQLLFNQSEESTKNINGLGLLSGDVLDLGNFVDTGTPVPHMGGLNYLSKISTVKL